MRAPDAPAGAGLEEEETLDRMRHPPTIAKAQSFWIGALTLALCACGSSGGASPPNDAEPPPKRDAGHRKEVDTGVPEDARSYEESGPSRDAGEESGADSSLHDADDHGDAEAGDDADARSDADARGDAGAGGSDAGGDSTVAPMGLWSSPSSSGPPPFSGPTVSATVAVTQGKTVGQMGPGFV